MKKLFLMVALLWLSLSMVAQNGDKNTLPFDENTSLVEVCNILEIPYKKVALYLNINPQDEFLRTQSISYFEKTPLDMLIFEQRFRREMLDFSSALVILAMTVTFVALLLMAFAMSRLAIVGRKPIQKAPTAIETPVGKVVLENNDILNGDVVVAVVAAIERYKAEKSKDHRIMLTWRRANVSMWQASSKVYMPNRNYNLFKK